MDEKYVKPLRDADDADFVAQEARIMKILAEPVDLLAGSSKLLDDFVEEMEQQGGEMAQPGSEVQAENPYRTIFLTPDADEKPLTEILQEIEAVPEAESLADESPLDLPSSPDESDSVTVGAIAAGAAILAGAGAAIAAKLGSKKEGEAPRILWHYAVDGQQYDPLPKVELREKLRSGQLPAGGYVWREGLKDWIPVSEAGLLIEPEPASQLAPRAAVQVSPDEPPVSKANNEPGWLYLDANHQTVGPVTKASLMALLSGGQLNGESLVWTEGMAAWQSAAAAGLVARPVMPPVGQNCPSCGKPLAAGSKFCGGCGAKVGVSVAGPAATPGPAVCPQCRAELKPNVRFCGKCGQKVS